MIDTTAADYCPHCGQPRETYGSVERYGLSLDATVMRFGENRTILANGLANFARTILFWGRASQELLILRSCPNAEDARKMIHVYARRLRGHISEVAGGAVTLNTLHSWGYELGDARRPLPLTDLQERFWKYILACDRSPTQREMMTSLGIKSWSVAHNCIRTLEERGFVRRQGRARTIEAVQSERLAA